MLHLPSCISPNTFLSVHFPPSLCLSMNLSTSAASTLDSARKLMTSTQADIEYKLSPGTFSKVTTASLGRTTVYEMPTEVRESSVLPRPSQVRPVTSLFQIVIKWVAHSVATPALLCHKEPAQGTQSPLLGALPFAGSLWHKSRPSLPILMP